MEEIILKAREVEDEVRARLRSSRRTGFYSWCRAGSEGSMRALFPWVRDGPRSMQSTGIYLKEGRFFRWSGGTARSQRRRLVATLAAPSGALLVQGCGTLKQSCRGSQKLCGSGRMCR